MDTSNNLQKKPSWFNLASVSETMDAREMLRSSQHPLAEVIKRTSELKAGQIFELITPFTPMPLIEKIKDQGFSAYVVPLTNAEIHTYFCKE